MLTSLNLTDAAIILGEGDSRDDMAFQYQGLTLVKTYIRSKYALAGHATVPTMTIDAVNGSLFGTILARLPAELAAVNPTHFFLDAGVNNVDHPEIEDLTTTLANLAAILDLTAGVGIKTCFTAPFWTSQTLFPGAPARLPTWNAAMMAVAAGYANCLPLNLYTLLNGPVNGVAYTVDEIHWNLAGKRKFRDLVVEYLQLH